METEFYLFSYSQVNKLDIYSFVHELEILQHVKLIALKPKWICKDTVALKQIKQCSIWYRKLKHMNAWWESEFCIGFNLWIPMHLHRLSHCEETLKMFLKSYNAS